MAVIRDPREMVERAAVSDSGVSAAFETLADRRVFQLDDVQ
jgi:hypothetical protein